METAITNITNVTNATVKASRYRYDMVSFYVDSRKKRCSADTNELCRDRLNTVIDDLTNNYGVIINKEQIVGLTGVVLQRWYNKFVDTRKPSTINNYLSFLKPFLTWSFKLGYLPFDIADILQTARLARADEVPEWERPKEKYLTHEDAKKLLSAQIGDDEYALRNRAIVALFLYSGIRVSELCSLTIGSIMNSPLGKIYCKRKGGLWKYVEVADPFYDYLNDYLDTRDTSDLNAPLFMTNRGGFMDRRLIYLTLAPIQKKLEIATGSHALRHTFISEVDKIAGPTVARDLANHSSLKITNRYDHTTEEQRTAALEALNWD